MAFVCQIPRHVMENHHPSPLLYDHHGHHSGGPLPRRGMWSVEEHDRFLQALKRFPDGPWQQLALCIGTRSTRQVQTHAQKYFEKIRRRQRGLQRSYVHSGTVREHRVDDDVVAMLSSPALAGDGEGDDEEKADAQREDDSGSSQEERSENGNAANNNTSTSPRVRSSRDAKSPASQPSLPRRIRIRRSARNALRVASHDGLFLQTLLATEAASASARHVPSADEIMAEDPTALPTIEEALDFFLSTMDTTDFFPTSDSLLTVGI